MKIRFVIPVLSVLLAVIVSCASGGSGGVAPIGKATGTAEAVADGFGGKVQVTIIMANGYITDVQIKGENETPAIGGAAIIRAPIIIKQRNSPQIDTVSGATVTSSAIITAAKAAVDKIVAGN